jgi:hypothetical protein
MAVSRQSRFLPVVYRGFRIQIRHCWDFESTLLAQKQVRGCCCPPALGFVQGERGRGRDPRARFVGGGEAATQAGKLHELYDSRVTASTASG